MNVKIVLFPEGEDPDSYARNHSTSETENFINNTAADFIKFKTGLLLDETANDPAGRATLIKDIVQTISVIPDGITRSVYIKECGVLLDVGEQTLMNELNKLLRQKFRKQSNIPLEVIPQEDLKEKRLKQIDVDPLDISYLENDLIRLLLLFGDSEVEVTTEDDETIEISVSTFIIDDLENDNLSFENKLFCKILDEFKGARKDDKVLSTAHFTNHPDPQISALAIELISTPYELSDNWEKNKIFVKKEGDNLFDLVLSNLMSFKSRLINKKLDYLSKSINDSTDDAEIHINMLEFIELKKIARLIDDDELNRPFSY